MGEAAQVAALEAHKMWVMGMGGGFGLGEFVAPHMVAELGSHQDARFAEGDEVAVDGGSVEGWVRDL